MSTTAISKQDFLVTKKWFDQSSHGLPSEIAINLERILAVYDSLSMGAIRSKTTLAELRRAMGITPKSEKGSQLNLSQASLDVPNSTANAGKLEELKSKRSEAWSQKLNYDQEIKKLLKPVNSPDQIEFNLDPPGEMLFSYPISNREDEFKKLRVDRMDEFEKEKGLISNYDNPKRVSLEVKVTKINYSVETVTDPLTGKTVRASTAAEGPENFQITWEAVSNLIKMHVGFAIPINRIALMIGQPEFSSSKICRILKHSATNLVPVYLQLGEELSDVKIISGDDTPTKILELVTEEECDLSTKINEHFNWTSKKSDGSGDKKAVNVSLLVGRAEADKRSTIRFFRTHQGSVGNVLQRLLECRNPKSGDLIFQGDLSTTNLPSAELQELFNLIVAGCGSHARRPFWKHKEQDEDFCYFMLRGFAFLARIEKIIDAHGRTRKNVLKFRGHYGQKIWIALRNRCIAAVTGQAPSVSTLRKGLTAQQWPPATDLYKAANYVIKNFKELTVYLEVPELAFTNNGQERALRIEKCALSSSKFSKTKGGRAAIDILRTINATCTAAEVDFTEYLRYISVHKQLLQEDPKRLTPFAVAKALQKLSAPQ